MLPASRTPVRVFDGLGRVPQCGNARKEVRHGVSSRLACPDEPSLHAPPPSPVLWGTCRPNWVEDLGRGRETPLLAFPSSIVFRRRGARGPTPPRPERPVAMCAAMLPDLDSPVYVRALNSRQCSLHPLRARVPLPPPHAPRAHYAARTPRAPCALPRPFSACVAPEGQPQNPYARRIHFRHITRTHTPPAPFARAPGLPHACAAREPCRVPDQRGGESSAPATGQGGPRHTHPGL